MQQRKRSVLGALGLALAVGLLGTSIVAARTGDSGGDDLPVFGPGSSYHPVIEPADFSPNVTNPWFPLKPGTTVVGQFES